MADVNVGQIVITAGVASVGFLQTMILSRINTHGRVIGEVKESITKLQVWATGLEGDNGINSMVKQSEERIAALEQRHATERPKPARRAARRKASSSR